MYSKAHYYFSFTSQPEFFEQNLSFRQSLGILQLDLTSSASSRILNVSSATRNELPLYSKRKSRKGFKNKVIKTYEY